MLDDVPGQTGPRADAKPLVYVLQVGGHRALADEQPVGDLGVAETFRDQPSDLRLPGAQLAGSADPPGGDGAGTEPAQQPAGAVGYRPGSQAIEHIEVPGHESHGVGTLVVRSFSGRDDLRPV